MQVLGRATVRVALIGCLTFGWAVCWTAMFLPWAAAQVRPIELAPSVSAGTSASEQVPDVQPAESANPPPGAATREAGAAPQEAGAANQRSGAANQQSGAAAVPASEGESTAPPAASSAAATSSTATPPTAPASSADATDAWVQQLAQRQQQLQLETERSPEAKEQLNKTYEQLRLDWEAANKARSRRQEYTDAAAAAPALLEATKARKAELEANKSPPSTLELSELSYEELDQRRMALEAELTTLGTERTALTEAISKRDKRRKELPQLISDAKSKLEQLGQQAPAAASEDPLLKEAAVWSFDVTRKLLSEQQQSYEAEQRLYEAEAPLLPLQLDVVQATEKRTQERLRLVNEQLDRIRTNRILNTAREARSLIAAAPREYRSIGKQLLEQIEEWRDLAAQQVAVKAELEEAQRLLARWSERRTQMDARVETKPGTEGVSNVITGFNSWVGLMLRKQRSELPDPQQLRVKLNNYQSDMQAAESLLFDIQDSLQEIELQQEVLEQREAEQAVDDADAVPNDWSGGQSGRTTAEQRTSADQRAAAELLTFTAATLQTIRLDVNAYQDDLYDLADVRERTIVRTKEYREFIDKHVLWIRSAERLSATDWRPGSEAFAWLVDAQNWQAVGLLLGQDVVEQPGWAILFVLVMLALIWNQTRMRRRLAELSSKAEKNNCTNYHWTVRSLILTVLVTAPVTLTLLFLYWRLSRAAANVVLPTTGGDFPGALAAGLLLMVCIFYPLEFARQLCRHDGLGVKHFGWREKVAIRLRVNLRWLINVSVPLAGIIGMLHNHPVQRWESSLGRVAFILLMLLLCLFLARVFAPRSGVVSGFLASHAGGWVDRLSWFWYPLVCLLPLALAAVSYVGFHYTAERLAVHVVSTLWMVTLVSVAYFMLMRWLVLNRRRLMLAQARQRLEDAAKRDPSGELPAPAEESRVDLVAINEQTRRLVTSFVVTFIFVMLFVIWSDVLPAVALLEGVRLWPVQGEVTKDTFTVTLANVLVVVPIVLLFVISGRNVPGLLEIAFLQHLPLTGAARYAITTLSRYAIFGLGIIVVASVIGLKWHSIQWLVAALGVGLGFGLQEIFANFVSGLILLFEQPIRVGDVVSIDGTTGSVSKIRMRATTIVNWDRQELIVPNKDLITNKLLNWTLSDTTNRIEVKVGVAYGSDTRKASQLLREICDENPNIMQDPPPSVTFERFDNSSLSLTLRAFLSSLDNRLSTINELHQQIYQRFAEAGIEIAFPHRDLHLRSLPDNLERWLGHNPPTET